MARTDTTRYVSDKHEAFVARKYNGHQVKGSGSLVNHKGDVRVVSEAQLIECKATGKVDKPALSISLKLETWEKIADEAYSEGKTPMVALRIYNPGSSLADVYGNIDMIVRLVRDDV